MLWVAAVLVLVIASFWLGRWHERRCAGLMAGMYDREIRRRNTIL